MQFLKDVQFFFFYIRFLLNLGKMRPAMKKVKTMN